MKAITGCFFKFIQLSFYQVKACFWLGCMKFTILNENIPVNPLSPTLLSPLELTKHQNTTKGGKINLKKEVC